MVNNTWTLIYKKLNKTATLAELEEINQILQDDGGSQYPMAMLEHLWQMDKSQGTRENEPNEAKWQALKAKINSLPEEQILPGGQSGKVVPKSKSPTMRRLRLLAAAAAILICSTVAMILFIKPDEKNGISEVKVPMGGMSSVQLPDGSTIILNAGSTLTYKNSFDSRHREVVLSGEAFFDIVKDPAHPFVVLTPKIRIKVLGTRFNVKAYPGDKITEASLLRGIIELTVLKNPDRQIIMKPSEKLTLLNEDRKGPIRNEGAISDTVIKAVLELGTIHQTLKDSLPAEAIWIDNKVVFDGTEFSEVAKMMERKYNAKIIFKRDELKKIIMSGKFENVTLDKAMKQLQLIANFNYQIINNQVFIF